MKLSDQAIKTITAATGLTPIAEDSAPQREFEPHFGEHTFYADKVGLFIFEPAPGQETDADGAADKVHGVQIAEWIKRDGKTVVGVVQPTPINLTVDLTKA